MSYPRRRRRFKLNRPPLSKRLSYILLFSVTLTCSKQSTTWRQHQTNSATLSHRSRYDLFSCLQTSRLAYSTCGLYRWCKAITFTRHGNKPFRSAHVTTFADTHCLRLTRPCWLFLIREAFVSLLLYMDIYVSKITFNDLTSPFRLKNGLTQPNHI